jgi:hypothetical protein
MKTHGHLTKRHDPDWLALLPRITEIMDSILGPQAGYLDRMFMEFLSLPKKMHTQYFKLSHDHFLSLTHRIDSFFRTYVVY